MIAGGALEAAVLVAWTFGFALIGWPLQALVHALAYRLMGVPAGFALDPLRSDSGIPRWTATLSGLSFRLALGCLGAFVFPRALDEMLALAGLGLAFSHLSVRPVLNLAMLSGRMLGNDLSRADEVQIADALGAPRAPIILVSFVLYGFMLALSVLLGLRFGLRWWGLTVAFLMAFAGTALAARLGRRWSRD